MLKRNGHKGEADKTGSQCCSLLDGNTTPHWALHILYAMKNRRHGQSELLENLGYLVQIPGTAHLVSEYLLANQGFSPREEF